jgi:hypothetical protein
VFRDEVDVFFDVALGHVGSSFEGLWIGSGSSFEVRSSDHIKQNRGSLIFVLSFLGVPPLPGDKPNGCSGLASITFAKFGQTKGLSLNLGKQRGYGLNVKPPAPAEGFS